MSSAFRHRHRTRGQALVEFVIVLPVMLLILLVAVDFGRLFFSYIAVNNAAREGANYASLHAADVDSGFPLTAYETETINAASGEANVQGQRGEGALTVDPPFCFTPPATKMDCDAASDFAPGIGNQVRVTASLSFTFFTPIISGIVGVLPLTASATAPVLNPPVGPLPPPPTPTPGSLVVTKVLAGDLTGFGGGEFTFDVSCNAQSYGSVTVTLASGTKVSNPITGIPAGVVCTVTEADQPRAGAHASWDSPDPEHVTIVESTQANVRITNTRTYTAPTAGSLVVTKALAGDLTGFTGGDFTFAVSCDGQSYGPVTINLASDTKPSDPITGIPEGAVCTVTETQQANAGAHASWNNPGPEQATIVKNKQADVTITNTRTYIAPCASPLVTITPAATTDTTKQITMSVHRNRRRRSDLMDMGLRRRDLRDRIGSHPRVHLHARQQGQWRAAVDGHPHDIRRRVRSHERDGNGHVGLQVSTRHGQRGQALVEFALVFPVFMLILFGVIEVGRFVYTRQRPLPGRPRGRPRGGGRGAMDRRLRPLVRCGLPATSRRPAPVRTCVRMTLLRSRRTSSTPSTAWSSASVGSPRCTSAATRQPPRSGADWRLAGNRPRAVRPELRRQRHSQRLRATRVGPDRLRVQPDHPAHRIHVQVGVGHHGDQLGER